MPCYATSQEWLEQSQLLLEARPTTTRITTKYKITPTRRRIPKSKQASTENEPSSSTTTAAEAKPARGKLVLKTYDPVSGANLRYKTSKAAEVSRLILCLGKLSRPMAGLPELKDEVMTDAPAAAEGGTRAGTPAVGEKNEAPVAASGGSKQQQLAGGGGGGGKGKKKKGKK